MPTKRVGRYSDKIREQAAIEYALNGNMDRVSRDMNIPKSTLGTWKVQDWWDAITEQVRTEKASEHRATYARIVDEAQQQTLAKLPEATAAQANIIAATATDKVRLLDNMPTSITSKTETMTDLAKQFQALARDIKAKTVQVIDVTPHNKSEDKG